MIICKMFLVCTFYGVCSCNVLTQQGCDRVRLVLYCNCICNCMKTAAEQPILGLTHPCW